MKAYHQLDLYDPLGINRIGTLGTFVLLEAARKTNDVGALRLIINASHVPAAALDKNQRVLRDLRIVAYRAARLGAPNSFLLDTIWFVRSTKRIRTRKGAMLEVRAVCANHLLKRRIIAYAAGSANAKKTGAADDMIKQFARENLGTSAIAARQMAGVTIEGNASLGPSITKACAWQNLLMVAQDIAGDAAQQSTPSYIYFDIVPSAPDALTLRTFIGQRGVDRTQKKVLSTDNGNLDEDTTLYDAMDEITYVYCGGQGEGALRTISEATDAARAALSPYNRIEAFVDARNTDDSTALPGEARAAVRAGRPHFTYDGKLVNVAQSVYGIDFRFGDKVRAQSDVDSFDCWIDAVKITVDSNGEQIDIRLGSAE